MLCPMIANVCAPAATSNVRQTIGSVTNEPAVSIEPVASTPPFRSLPSIVGRIATPAGAGDGVSKRAHPSTSITACIPVPIVIVVCEFGNVCSVVLLNEKSGEPAAVPACSGPIGCHVEPSYQ